MQENKYIEDEDKGVSPVIATILMVAITVVLAGVLYVWASELAGNQTDFGTFNSYAVEDAPGSITGAISDPLVRMSFASGGDDLSWSFLEIKMMNEERVIPCKVGTMPDSQVDAPDRDIEADVTFTVIDDGYDFTAVSLSASFNGFSSASMTNDGTGTWTLTVTLAPGDYSWSAEGDGEDLISLSGMSENPSVTVSDEGVVSGENSITVTAPEPEPECVTGDQCASGVCTESTCQDAPDDEDDNNQVIFRVIDQGNSFTDIQIKGEFNGWIQEPMTAVGNGVWEFVSTDLTEGTYEWGAVENDGSDYGIWLPGLASFSSNPVMTVDADGNGLSTVDVPVSTGTPISFFVNDPSSQYFDIEIKGDFSNWALWQMYETEPGVWAYTLSLDDGTYEWGAVENDGSEFGVWLPTSAGFSSNPTITLSADNKQGDLLLNLPETVVFPITFTVVDDGNNYQDIEIKGELPPDYDWNLRNMNSDGNTWTYVISLQPGTYEWGAIENDGTEWGVWLPGLAGFSSNPTVIIGNDGSVSGDVTFTVPDQNPDDNYYTMNEGDSSDSEPFQFVADCVIVESGSDSTAWEANEILTIYEGGNQICSSWNECEIEISVYYRGKLIAGDSGLNQLY